MCTCRSANLAYTPGSADYKIESTSLHRCWPVSFFNCRDHAERFLATCILCLPFVLFSSLFLKDRLRAYTCNSASFLTNVKSGTRVLLGLIFTFPHSAVLNPSRLQMS